MTMGYVYRQVRRARRRKIGAEYDPLQGKSALIFLAWRTVP